MSKKIEKIIADRKQDLVDLLCEAIDKSIDVFSPTERYNKAKRVNDRGYFPHNPITGTVYKGLNAAKLYIKGRLTPNEDGCFEFVTINQIENELKGSVKENEKPIRIRYFHKFEKLETKSDEELETMSEEDRQLYAKKLERYNQELEKFDDKTKEWLEKNGKVFLLRNYSVFNIAQCENIDKNALENFRDRNKDKIPQLSDFESVDFVEIPEIEQIIKNSGIRIIEGETDVPFYAHRKNPDDEFIKMPYKNAFKNDENLTNSARWYSTILHELAHSTMHESRLDRKEARESYSDSLKVRAKEELVAETASLLLSMSYGVPHDLYNHASYLEGWSALGTSVRKEWIAEAVEQAFKVEKFVKDNWETKKQINDNELAQLIDNQAMRALSNNVEFDPNNTAAMSALKETLPFDNEKSTQSNRLSEEFSDFVASVDKADTASYDTKLEMAENEKLIREARRM